MEDLVRFYKGKKVFLTGHTGFKGSWMLALFDLLGAEVKGYALPPEDPSMFNIIGGEKLCRSVYADIRDRERLRLEMESFEPEIVFHLAAQPLVIEGYKEPVKTFETNVLGTVNLLESVRGVPSVRAVVNVTTDKVYENPERGEKFNEFDRLGGDDPYACSKACSELVTSCYRESYFKGGPFVASARAGNVVGGGDFAADRLIPDCVRAAASGKRIEIRSPESIRPWQHVIEPLVCYLKLAKALFEEGARFAAAFNIGPDEENFVTAGEVTGIFCKLWGGNLGFSAGEGKGFKEAKVLKLDNGRAKEMLSFKPLYDIHKTIELVVSWTKAYLEGRDMLKVTKGQI